jgi:hypothetical protein
MITVAAHTYKLAVVLCLAMSNECYEVKLTDEPMTFPTEILCEEKGAEVIERVAATADEGKIPPYFIVAKCESEDGFSARRSG